MGSPGEGFYWVACCVAMIVAIIVLLRRSYRYFGRGGRDQPPLVRVSPPHDLAAGDDASTQRMRDEVHLHETARALSARLDSKISILEFLTGTAEQQIERLQELVERAERIGNDATAGGTGADRPAKPTAPKQ
jgi:hypothetical protein